MVVFNFGTFGSGRDQVIQEIGRREGVAVIVIDEVLIEHPADSLNHPSSNLAFDNVGVDHHPAVFADDEALHLHLAGRDVDSSQIA